MNRLSLRSFGFPSLAATILAVGSIGVPSVWAQSTPAAAASTGAGAAASYTDLGYGQYPRVTEIEQQLLGKTYEKEPLETRVARLETKQFGKTSPKDDLADRLDRLDKYITPKTQMATDDNREIDYSTSRGNSSAGANSANSADPPVSAQPGNLAGRAATTDSQPQYSASDYGSYPRVTELEQQFLGTTYVKDPLPVRVARLEEKKFGKTTPNDDLCDRIDRLDKIANPRQNSRMADNQDDASGGSQGSNGGNKGSGKAGAIGRTLLNMIGGAMGGGGMGGMGGMGMMGNGLSSMMPGLQSDMREDAAKKRGQQDGGASGVQTARTPAAPTNPFAPGASPVTGDENKIAAIEKMVLGKEHAELPMEERLAHVEKKLVPYEHHQASQNVKLRIDHLWSILSAANKPSTRSVAAADESAQ